jgi:hypothetical protein
MPLTARLPGQLLVLALSIGVPGCHPSDLTEISYETPVPGIQAGYVSVTPTSDGLVVFNQTERPIYFVAINAEMLALWDWAPCTAGAGCPALAQGQQRLLPWSSVMGYDPSTKQFSLSWWHVVVLPDGTARADEVHTVSVTR